MFDILPQSDIKCKLYFDSRTFPKQIPFPLQFLPSYDILCSDPFFEEGKMRAIRSFVFETANKITFSQLPEIVRRFLAEQRLSANVFLYYLECYDKTEHAIRFLKSLDNNPRIKEFILRTSPETIEENRKIVENPPKTALARAVTDCPKLGAVKTYTPFDEQYGSDHLYVSNIIEPTECTEADMQPFFKRMERTYGLSEAVLYYCDVDFFGKVIPYVRDLAPVQQRSEALGYPFDEAETLDLQPYGSMVCITRSVAGPRWNDLTLSVDILHDGTYYDPSPYYEAMKALLPGIKSRTLLRVIPNDKEQAAIEASNAEAAPLIAECSAFLSARLSPADRQTMHQCNYSLAPKLKKLAKNAGYSYSFVWSGVFGMNKRLPRGHYLSILVTSGQSHYDTTFHLNFDGLGFSHALTEVMFAPTDQSEFDACADAFFAAVRAFETGFASKLDCLYDPTPAWFFPND